MTLPTLTHGGYWILVYLFLALLFSVRGEFVYQALFFSAMLTPVLMAATYAFLWLVLPRYFGKDWLQFFFWSACILGVTFYLVVGQVTVLFVLIAEYQIAHLNPALHDFYFVMSGSLLVIMPAVIAQTLKDSRRLQRDLEQLREQHADSGCVEGRWLQVSVDGRTERIRTDQIRLLEARGDYVDLYLGDGVRRTREPLYRVLERLPDHFFQTHRSFAINIAWCRAFARTEVDIDGHTVPVSRTYREQTMRRLQTSVPS